MLEEIIEVIKSIHIRQDHHAEWMKQIERNQRKIMAGIKELNDAIAALPQKVADDIIPLIPVPTTGGGDTGGPTGDTSAQIEALAQVPSQVASLVQAALAVPAPVDTSPTE